MPLCCLVISPATPFPATQAHSLSKPRQPSCHHDSSLIPHQISHPTSIDMRKVVPPISNTLPPVCGLDRYSRYSFTTQYPLTTYHIMLPTTRAAARPIIRAATNLQVRSYAVLSGAYSVLGYKRTGDQPDVAPLAEKSTSKASNGIQIATYDEHSPVSTLAVVVKAGSRYEAPEAPGTAQLVKNTIFRVSFPVTDLS